MSDNVVALPLPAQRPVSCFICKHALVGEQTYCRLFEEFILTEAATAADCDRYEEDQEK